MYTFGVTKAKVKKAFDSLQVYKLKVMQKLSYLQPQTVTFGRRKESFALIENHLINT
jgi:hypothetical protein